jgi:NADH dehydrogenase
MSSDTNHVLIVGGGFGGIKAALLMNSHDNLRVTLLSERADFCYYPELYHTATGGMREQTSIRLTDILPAGKVDIVIGKAEKLDRAEHAVITTDGQKLKYDTVIFGLGSQTNYFGIAGLAEYSYGIKSQAEIQRFKKHLHQQLTSEHKPDLNYVIVGGGPTGIELAGSLPGYLREIMHNHNIVHRAVHIDLVESAPRLLPRSPKTISRAVRRQLRHLGIKLYLGKAVQGETADMLTVSGKPITSHTVIWTAGVTNSPFFKDNGFVMTDRGKVVVDDRLEAEPGIYVIGDNAATQYSGMAQTALDNAEFVCDDIVRKLAGQSRKTYQPKKPVTVIPVGPNWAAVEWGRFRFAGRLGWIIHELANLSAFHDYEPWWKASEQWLTELGHEEECPICAKA